MTTQELHDIALAKAHAVETDVAFYGEAHDACAGARQPASQTTLDWLVEQKQAAAAGAAAAAAALEETVAVLSTL